jgi:hypothetical protein
VLALLIPAGLGGCRASVGGRDIFFRVSREVPPMVQEETDGRRVELPGVEPAGDSVFFFIRGRL